MEKGTKQEICKAVLSIMKTTDIPKITVGNVVKQAQISRSTFYRYYDSVDAIIKEMENEILDAIEEVNRLSLMERCIASHLESSQSAIPRSRILVENRERIAALTGPHGDPQFTYRMSKVMRNYFQQKLKDMDIKNKDFYIEYLVAGFCQVVAYLVTKRPDIGTEELATLLNHDLLAIRNDNSAG